MQWAKGAVSIAASFAASGLLIEIADDGPGIPVEARDRLLIRGARLDETTQGHGLGLAIAADHTREYGGTVELDVSKTGGLLVQVRLPGRT